MKKTTIILTGFMACGKTTVAQLLAKELGYTFIDTDQLIEEKTAKTVKEIFEQEGESAFRALEREIAAEISQANHQVVATGGRLLCDPVNADILGKSGIIFCLTARPEVIAERLSQQEIAQRPLLQNLAGSELVTKIQQMIEQRSLHYQTFSQIDSSDRSPIEVVRVLLSIINF